MSATPEIPPEIGRVLWGMAPMPSANLSVDNRKALLEIARNSIACGFESRQACLPKLARLPEVLRANGASFITLSNRGKLRGCTGSILAKRPLGFLSASGAKRRASCPRSRRE